jgi:DNA end-binding protein Ku
MAPRANWKGYLKLSLVSCAVSLFPASTDSNRVTFHTLNAETGNRLRRQMIDPETGDVIEREDQVKGYEIAKGHYVTVTEDELNAIALESTHTIDIERFVPRDEIDPLYFDTPYYLAPDDRVAEEAFAVIRDAMEERGMVGIGRVVLYRRERMLMLEPRGRGLFGQVLRYPYEVRAEKPYFEDIPDIKVPRDMLDLAAHIIETKSGHFEPQSFEDRYENAVIALVRSKDAGKPAALPQAAPRPSNVVNLMDALRRSLAAEGETAAPPPAAEKAKPKPSKRGKPQKPAAKASKKSGKPLKRAS